MGPRRGYGRNFMMRKAERLETKLMWRSASLATIENREHCFLGIVACNMMECVVAVIEGTVVTVNEIGIENGRLGRAHDDETALKVGLSGCHDTILAAVLSSFGSFECGKWPPF